MTSGRPGPIAMPLCRRTDEQRSSRRLGVHTAFLSRWSASPFVARTRDAVASMRRPSRGHAATRTSRGRPRAAWGPYRPPAALQRQPAHLAGPGRGACNGEVPGGARNDVSAPQDARDGTPPLPGRRETVTAAELSTAARGPRRPRAATAPTGLRPPSTRLAAGGRGGRKGQDMGMRHGHGHGHGHCGGGGGGGFDWATSTTTAMAPGATTGHGHGRGGNDQGNAYRHPDSVACTAEATAIAAAAAVAAAMAVASAVHAALPGCL